DSASAVDLDMRLALAMRRYWFERGLLGLGYRMTLEVLANGTTRAPSARHAATLNDAGQIAAHMGRYDEARGHLVESLAIARSIGDRQRIAFVLQPLALACAGVGDLGAARTYLREGLELAREYGDQREVAAALNALAQIARMEGDLATAELLYQQVLDLGRGIPHIESVSLLNLAMVAIGRGAPDRARAMLLEVVAICAETDSRLTGQSVIEVSAGLAADLGDGGRAITFFGAAERQAGLSGIHRDPTDEAFLAPRIARARASLAADACAGAEAAGRALDYATAIAEVHAWLAAAGPEPAP
ncbi:MAG: tetratricopeptide repeat protein, partial [Casimicrobiaceae bacterium]